MSKGEAMSYITRAVTSCGGARIIFADTTDIVRKAAEIHGTSKTMTAALGRVLTATAMMGSLLKDKDNSITVQFKGNGPAGTVVCVSDYMGNVRGYAEDPTVELAPNEKGKLDVGGAIGRNGTLYVIKDMGFPEPYVGMCPIVSGEVGDDITGYFASSEQTPTVCALGVRVDKDLNCKAAGGFLIQLLPGADDELTDKLEQNIAMIDSVSAMIESGKTAEEIIAVAFSGIEHENFDEFDISYKCNCGREKYERALITLPESDFESLGENGEPIEAVCRFCNEKYVFSYDELDRIRNKG